MSLRIGQEWNTGTDGFRRTERSNAKLSLIALTYGLWSQFCLFMFPPSNHGINCNAFMAKQTLKSKSALTHTFHNQSTARPENTMPAALQRKKDSSTVSLSSLSAIIPFSGMSRRLFVKYTGYKPGASIFGWRWTIKISPLSNVIRSKYDAGTSQHIGKRRATKERTDLMMMMAS